MKYALATRNLQKMDAFSRFKDEIWCVDLAYIDELANDNNGVSYLLVRQDLFDRMVDAKRMKTKGFEEMVRAFLKLNTKKNRPTKIWNVKGTKFAEEFKKLGKSEG